MAIFQKLRGRYHGNLGKKILGFRPDTDVPNIADTSSDISKAISRALVSKLSLKLEEKRIAPQTVGQLFAELTCDFVREAFGRLPHLRPGRWVYSTSQAHGGITEFDQYEHLARLRQLVQTNEELKAALGRDYLITPDIIIGRKPEPDTVINSSEELVRQGEGIVSLAPLREGNTQGVAIMLHASISCKWTIRSDRAQNIRTEALNLIRNRKGNTPHVVAITFEPTPNRLASIALGTGDLDCTYHAALQELREAVKEVDPGSASELLEQMVQGRRLRDISDLPLDLAV